MEYHVGMDISLELSSLCVLNEFANGIGCYRTPIFGALGQFERVLIQERTRASLVAAAIPSSPMTS